MLVDIFRNDLFRTTSLTAAINAVETPPQRLAELGLFDEKPVRTTSVVIERKDGVLSIIPAKARGSDPTPMKDNVRSGISLEVPHYPARDTLLADEVQGVRAFGSEDELEGVEAVRDDKLTNMANALDATEEYARLGAVQGVILDHDGSVIYDLFDEFGVVEPNTIFLDLSASHTAGTAPIRTKLTLVKDTMRRILKNRPVRGVWAPCGTTFFEKLTNHPEVRETYLNQQEAADLRGGDPMERFTYGGATFELYPGYGDIEIDADECRFIPVGVPGLFVSSYAPAPWFSAVNTLGLPRYSMATLDPTGEKRIDLESQTNGLHICTRPEVLIPGSRLAS